MKVSAADKGTGKSSSVTIENERGRLSQEEIDRVRLLRSPLERVDPLLITSRTSKMVADSEKFAEEDELIKKKIEARNALENCMVLPLIPSLRMTALTPSLVLT
jgi:heat shock protein 5